MRVGVCMCLFLFVSCVLLCACVAAFLCVYVCVSVCCVS